MQLMVFTIHIANKWKTIQTMSAKIVNCLKGGAAKVLLSPPP